MDQININKELNEKPYQYDSKAYTGYISPNNAQSNTALNSLITNYNNNNNNSISHISR